MKKVLFALLAIVMIATVSFGQTTGNTTIKMTLTLDKYIEVVPGPLDWDLGITNHFWASEWAMASSPSWDLAYANCGFTATVSGENPASEHKPRFAMPEVGPHASGFDTLPTQFMIAFTTNGVSDVMGPLGFLAAEAFPFSKNYTEAPHNGQVGLMMTAWVNHTFGTNPDLPTIRQTLINPGFSIRDSADAGIYTCSMVVTLTAL